MSDNYPFGNKHSEVQKHNKALHDQNLPKRESNHVPPKSVYTGDYEGLHENHMPAHSILYEDHRVGKGKVGDGATSTGGSAISIQYREQMKEHMSNGNFYLAMSVDINDLKNTHGIDRSFYNVGLLEAATYAREIGLIKNDEQLNYVYGVIVS